MADGSTDEELPLSGLLIGLGTLLVTIFCLLLVLFWWLRSRLVPKAKPKSERKTKTTSNPTKQRRSSKPEAHLKGKVRSVRADAKKDGSPQKESRESKDHSHRDRPHKDHPHKDHPHKEHNKFQKEPESLLDQTHKTRTKIDIESENKIHEVSSIFEEESKFTKEQGKASPTLDASTSSLKLNNSPPETPYPDSQTARPSAVFNKMDSEFLANINALGVNDSFGSSVKRDLHETLYKQNVSLFSVKNSSVNELMPKDTSTLSAAFKMQNLPTKKV